MEKPETKRSRDFTVRVRRDGTAIILEDKSVMTGRFCRGSVIRVTAPDGHSAIEAAKQLA